MVQPYVTSSSIDPNVGILKVDDINGKPIATLWNFAIHGVCWGPDNMEFSSDIMGGACDNIEALGGGVALFMNADAGDISPNGDACAGKPDYAGAHTIANTVMASRSDTPTYTVGHIATSTNTDYFGHIVANWTLAREFNCTEGGPFSICTICDLLHCKLNLKGGEGWSEETPRFTGFRFTLGEKETLFVSIPGEALFELGQEIRSDGASLGYDQTFLMGYSNNYLQYFATSDEYQVCNESFLHSNAILLSFAYYLLAY